MYILHGILLSQEPNEHKHLGFIGNGLLSVMILYSIYSTFQKLLLLQSLQLFLSDTWGSTIKYM